MKANTVQTPERANGPPEGIKIKPHWLGAEKRERKNCCDLQRERSHA